MIVQAPSHGREGVWFDIAPTNIISQKATAKLGARYSHDHILAIGSTPQEWKAYAQARKNWTNDWKPFALRQIVVLR